MKLAQALYLGGGTDNGLPVTGQKPILLLDDIFDRLDSQRVERIVEMVQGEEFGQIFITDTDRQHLTEILKPNEKAKIFHVENGQIA
jgi:DNA replication and repair protein RecF